MIWNTQTALLLSVTYTKSFIIHRTVVNRILWKEKKEICIMYTQQQQCSVCIVLLLCPPPLGGSIKRWCCLTSVCLTSVWRLSVAYIGHKSRTERPRKTKIGTEVAYVARDSDTIFKVKRSKVKLTWASARAVTEPWTSCSLHDLIIIFERMSDNDDYEGSKRSYFFTHTSKHFCIQYTKICMSCERE